MVESLEEQQLLLKKMEELKLHNERLENVIMHTADRMWKMIDRCERKEEAVEKLEVQVRELHQRYEKENSLLQIQLDNQNEKGKMMSRGLLAILGMRNDIRVKNRNESLKDALK